MTTHAQGKLFFASDFHLGVPDHASSLRREKHIVAWLNSIRNEASEVFLVGDMFDFWFEYHQVIPKGFSRLIGTLCDMQDAGIRIHLFHGNHDMWQFGYLQQEIGCEVHPGPIRIERNGKSFYIAHGDGLGPGQLFFKATLAFYRNRLAQLAFAFLHPRIGITLAQWFSHRSKQQTMASNKQFLGEDKEYLILHARSIMQTDPPDYFIFGHRHLALDINLGASRMINLGEWFTGGHYAVFDGTSLSLKQYPF